MSTSKPFQLRYGKKLQQWPRIALSMKPYESGYIRKKASIFSKEQVEEALQFDNNSTKWKLRKAVLAVGYIGGLRSCELKSIKMGDVRKEKDGVWIQYFQAKKRGEEQTNELHVPFNHALPRLCYASRVLHYMDCLPPTLTPEDFFFRRPLANRFSDVEGLGVNAIANMNKDIAKELNLNPKGFAGHTLRRSCATEAANRGVKCYALKGCVISC